MPTLNLDDIPRHLVTREMLWAEVERQRKEVEQQREIVQRYV